MIFLVDQYGEYMGISCGRYAANLNTNQEAQSDFQMTPSRFRVLSIPPHTLTIANGVLSSGPSTHAYVVNAWLTFYEEKTNKQKTR